MELAPASAALNGFPRLPAADLPTPLRPLYALRTALGPLCPRLLVKRDDMTGLALGGNKARKLDFLLGDARARRAETLVTCGAAQSNHALQTAAAARRFGFRAVCVLDGPAPDGPPQGNLLLHQILETEIVWAEMELGETRREQARRRVMAEVAHREKEAGRAPYLIPTGGSTATGALGYVAAALELDGQLRDRGVGTGQIRAIYFASGSGGTHAGLALGARLLNWPAEIAGVEVDPIPLEPDGTSPYLRFVANLAAETAALLGIEPLAPDRLTLVTGNGGPAYGVPTPEGEEAIRLLAQTEGLFLDPVYSGKALAALLGHVREGRFRPDDTVLFWHTGGVAGLFATH